MVLITQGAASQQPLLRGRGLSSLTRVSKRGPESVSNVAGTTGHFIIRTGDPQQPTGGHTAIQLQTLRRLLAKTVGIRGVACARLEPITPRMIPQALST